jgi:hypothetical protein
MSSAARCRLIGLDTLPEDQGDPDEESRFLPEMVLSFGERSEKSDPRSEKATLEVA